ncbi:EVE domain-containing protein [Sphingomonas sp.]|uniref:EVE domain-containing protein n=1 Tax=Sphingomonas sp. TaxID=28214 RepID=UPI0031CFBDA8
MAYWLLKSEPESYGWDDLVGDGATEWDGVRNAVAAKYLRAMAPGDSAIIYHSGKDKAAVGLATITRAARPDGEDGRWVSVQVSPDRPLLRPVSLAAMKAEGQLADMAMLRQSRLSVSPVTDAEWAVLMAMAGL